MPSTRWGKAIRRLLIERGWNQKQLAKAASVRPNTLTNIIRHGKDSDTATLSRIATALEVDLAELFVTEEQSVIVRAYRENRIQRVKETVLSELATTVSRLVREDYHRLLAEDASATEPPRRKKRRRKT